MSSAVGTRANPYIGPREFHDNEAHLFFGRSKEVLDLARLLVAERIVLCHSPSGAGKTSLIRTRLREQLTKRRFTALPVIRTSQEVPPSLAPEVNRFVISTLLSLEAAFPEAKQLSLEQLSTLTLDAYARERLRDTFGDQKLVLIFDQFEEALLLDPLDLAAKYTFFQQLGELLVDERIWALFAIREDYVASLEPFAEPIPGRLARTYRLPLLELVPALEAIQKPAAAFGVTFADDAAAKLADDLRRVRMIRADNKTELRLGPYIEPVQLQVVCFRLWERLAPDTTTITVNDIETAFEGVDDALADYYNEYVIRIAHEMGASERQIRSWFDDKLITADGIRTQVRQGLEDSEGLPNAVVRRLVDSHLVRSERERGGVWLELAHDRLIEPIRLANSNWRKEHLSPLQKQAALWVEQGRPAGLLLSGQTFVEAEQWVAAHDKELSDVERDFLKDCREATRVQIEREARARARTRNLALATAIFVVIAILLGVLSSIALSQRALAETQAQLAQTETNNAQDAAEQARSQAATAQAAFSMAQTAQSQIDVSANEQAAVKLAADQLAALEGGDPDKALSLALGGLSAPIESPQLDLLLSRAADTSGTRVILPGNTNEILGVAVSPDGSLAYTGDRAGVIRMWNLADGSPAGTFRGHQGGIQEIVFSPDGRLIGTGSDDRTVRIWSATDGSMLHSLGPHTGPVTDLAFSPDSATLLAGSPDGPIRLWDIERETELKSFPGLPAVAFSVDGGAAIMVEKRDGSPDYTMLLIDLATGLERLRFQGHQRPIQDVLFTSDGRSLLSASIDGSIRLWDATTGQETRRFTGHTATVWSLALSNDGSRLLSSSADNTVRLWDIQTGEQLRQYVGHIGSVYRVVFTPDNTRFVSGAEDGQGRIWDVGSRQELAILKAERGSLQAVAQSPDGSEVIAGSTDGKVYRWERATGAALVPPLIGSIPVFGVAYSPQGERIAVGLQDGTVSVIPLRQGLAGWSSKRKGQVPSVAFSPDGKRVLSGSTEKGVYLWSADDGQLVATFEGLGSEATDIAFGPNGETVAASSQDWSIHLWDTASRADRKSYQGHLAGVLSVAVSPDGRTLASGGTDREVILWDVASGEIQHRLIGHAAAVWSVAFSPDGRFVASGSADRTVRVWDVATGREIRRFTGHTQRVWSVAFAADGASVLSSSSDQTVRIWRLESREELIAWIQENRYVPSLTCEQIKLYRLAMPCAESTGP